MLHASRIRTRMAVGFGAALITALITAGATNSAAASPQAQGELTVNVSLQGEPHPISGIHGGSILGYACDGGERGNLRIFSGDFAVVDFELRHDGTDWITTTTTLAVTPGRCGAWVVSGNEPSEGRYLSGGGAAMVSAGTETTFTFTGRETDLSVSCEGLVATILGTTNNDVLVGTPGADVIVADSGDDVVRGAGSNDVICGGPGDDLLWGNRGDDQLFGGSGNDVLRGGRDDDLVIGGAGFDIADGAVHTDMCSAEFARRCEG